MAAGIGGLLFLPVLLWLSIGAALAVVSRLGRPVPLLRLAAVFLGLWAVLATTALVWVLSNGGLQAIDDLDRAPLAPFAASSSGAWALGAIGALVVFAITFLLTQLVGRGLLRSLSPRPHPWPAGLPRPRTETELLEFHSERPEAFSFTIVARGSRPARGWRRREIVLLSDGLTERLTESERVAVIAHELGHVTGLDGRYLTFLRTLSRLMMWDPLLSYLARTLTRSEEYRADLASARLTGDPLALARALFKASRYTPARSALPVPGFLGAGSSGDTAERIRRLVSLAESMHPPEGVPGGLGHG